MASNTTNNSESDDIENQESDDIENPSPNTDDSPAGRRNINSDNSDSDQKMREHMVLAHGPGFCGSVDCPQAIDENQTPSPLTRLW